MHLAGKKIILAVTGSIAAYKTPILVRQLIKEGAEVKVIATEAALQFVSELSLATVSKNPVFSNVNDGSAWNNHVALGRWADVMLIAPCSANTLAKLANGLCDNLVCAVYLSATCPVLVAPAMDEDMWHHPTTKANLSEMRSYGNTVIPVAHGELASGLVGEGRMAEPEDIVDFVSGFLNNDKPLTGIKAMVSAGPTYERIDPVRFVGNFSSGKMGVSIAEELAKQGADVTLILGPSSISVQSSSINIVRVESAEDMYKACSDAFPTSDIAIMAAAVADFTPANVADEKIKKYDDSLVINLTKTKDILYSLGQQKKDGQLLVGFALETNNELENAKGKLAKKNADLIVLNSLNDDGAGFGHDTNKVTFVMANEEIELPLQSKADVAIAIVDHIKEMKHAEKTV